jgi:hypothetical protein
MPETLVHEIAEAVRQRKIRSFPNGPGKPNMHLLRVVQQVAEAAGKEGRVALHTFRRILQPVVRRSRAGKMPPTYSVASTQTKSCLAWQPQNPKAKSSGGTQ